MCECFKCNRTDNLTQVIDIDNTVVYVCDVCFKDTCFECTHCHNKFTNDAEINPCFHNDGSCPTLCEVCFYATDLLTECQCGFLRCDRHIAEKCDCDEGHDIIIIDINSAYNVDEFVDSHTDSDSDSSSESD